MFGRRGRRAEDIVVVAGRVRSWRVTGRWLVEDARELQGRGFPRPGIVETREAFGEVPDTLKKGPVSRCGCCCCHPCQGFMWSSGGRQRKQVNSVLVPHVRTTATSMWVVWVCQATQLRLVGWATKGDETDWSRWQWWFAASCRMPMMMCSFDREAPGKTADGPCQRRDCCSSCEFLRRDCKQISTTGKERGQSLVRFLGSNVGDYQSGLQTRCSFPPAASSQQLAEQLEQLTFTIRICSRCRAATRRLRLVAIKVNVMPFESNDGLSRSNTSSLSSGG